MKRIAMFMVLVAVFAIGATALQVSTPSLGGSNQDRNANVTTSVTITSNSGSDLSNIQVSFVADSKYSLSAQGLPTNVTASSPGSFTLNGFIPLDLDGVDPTTLKEGAVKVGTLTVTATNSSGSQESATVDVLMQAVNQLEINKARITCDTSSKSLDDGDTIKNLKPGESCQLEIEVENKFDDNDRDNLKRGDIEFDTVDINVDSSNSDVDVDVDDDISNLGADDKDSALVDVDIEDDADDRKVTLTIRVSGRDENGALHGEEISVKLDIERLTHDVQIRRIEVSPSRVSACEPSNVNVGVQILNQGRRDEREAAVEVSVPDFKFTDKKGDIELDKDDSTSVQFDVPVPEDVEPGVYRVDVRSFFDNVAQSNIGSVDLVVEECEEPEVPEPSVNVESQGTSTQTSVVSEPSQVVATAQGQAQAAPARSSGLSQSGAYVALLVLAIAIVLALIATMVVVLVRTVRKK